MNASTPTPDLNSSSTDSPSSPETGRVPHIVHAASVEALRTTAGQIRVLLDGSMTAGALNLTKVCSARGQRQTLTSSSTEDRVLVVHNGCFNILVDDTSFEIGAGEAVVVQHDVASAFSCSSDEGGTIYIITLLAEKRVATEDAPTSFVEKVSAGKPCSFDTALQGSALNNRERNSRPILLKTNVGESQPNGDHIVQRNASGDRYKIEEVCTSPLCGPPPMSKQDEDTLFLIINGRHEFCVGDARALLEPGHIVWVPRGVAHSWRALCVGSAHMITMSVRII